MAEGDVFRATVMLDGNLGTAVNFDFGYIDNNSGSTVIDTGTAAGAFQTLVQATLAAALPETVIFKRYRFACVVGPNVGQIGYVDVDPPVTGGITSGVVLPAEIAISMKRRTGYASRHDRGRVFFGPVHQQYQSSANIDEVQMDSTLTDIANLLKTNLTVSTRVLKPVILRADKLTPQHIINNVSVGEIFVHHKSRRFREHS